MKWQVLGLIDIMSLDLYDLKMLLTRGLEPLTT